MLRETRQLYSGERKRRYLALLCSAILAPFIIFTSPHSGYAAETRSQMPDPIQNLLKRPIQEVKENIQPAAEVTDQKRTLASGNGTMQRGETSLSSVDLMAGFSVHPLTGAPRLIIPIDVAPGLSFSPKIAMKYQGNIQTIKPTELWSLAGALPIRECIAREGFCLGDSRLIPLEDKIYKLENDPLSYIQKTNTGFVYSNGAGEKRHYEKSPKRDNHWRLIHATDPFENFIQYEYENGKRWPSKITYGFENATPSEQRFVQFIFPENTDLPPTRIQSMIGATIVKDYKLEFNDNSELVRVEECVPDTGESCRPFYQFDWITAGSPKPILHTATNELGGTINVDYLPASHGNIVASYSLLDNGQITNKTNFQYQGEIKGKNDLTIGFQKIAKINPANGTAVVTQFKTGPQQGLVLSTTQVSLDKKGFSFEDLNVSLSAQNTYKKIEIGSGTFFLLESHSLASSDEQGKSEILEKIEFEYDDIGRIVSRINNENRIVNSYVANETYPALLESKTVINRETGDVIERSSWKYEFEEEKLKFVTIKADNFVDDRPSTSASYQLDASGNILSLEQGPKSTKISYHPDFPSQPSKITWTSKAGDNNWLELDYDPSTGVLVKSINSLGLETSTEVDSFGKILKDIRKIPLPREEEGPKYLFEVKERKEVITDNGRLLVTETRSSYTDHETSPSPLLIQNTLYDGNARILRQEIKSPVESDELGSFLIENNYSETTISTRMTQSDGTWVETERDLLNRIIRQEDQIRGVIRYSYNNEGLISSINRNGNLINMSYDDLGRLKEKHLPGEGKYHYFYADDQDLVPGKVTLPGGHEVTRKYYTDGSQRSHRVSLKGPDNKIYHFETLFTYKNGAIETITYPDGSKINYDYAENFLTGIRWSNKTPHPWSDEAPYIARFNSSTDKDNNLYLKRFFHNGIVDARKWTPAGKIEQISVSDQLENKLLNMTFNRNENNLVASVTRTQENQTLTKEFNYSDQSRLASVSSILNGESTEEKFSYNDVGTLLSDSDGIRKYTIENTQNYRLRTRSDGLKLDYDKNGNLIRKQLGDNVSSYQFNALNYLKTAVIEKNGHLITTHMDYDERGERLIKQIDGEATTAYINPLYEITWNKDGSVQQTKYIPDPITTIASVTETLSADDLLQLVPATVNPDGSNHTAHIIPESSLIKEAFVKAEIWIKSVFSGKAIAFSEPVLMGLVVFFVLTLFDKSVRTAKREEAIFEKLFPSPSSPFDTETTLVRNRIFAVVSPIVIASFLLAILSPSAHAAVLKGQGIPEVNSVNYYHNTGNQSIILVTNKDGKISSSMDYQAYGALKNSDLTTGKDISRKKFAGMEYDATLGLYYNHARYYDPDLRRFISPDPANAGIDLYNYTESDPINYHDPDGRAPEENKVDALYDKGNYGDNPDQMSPYRKLLLHLSRKLNTEEKVRRDREETQRHTRERAQQPVTDEIRSVPPTHINPFWSFEVVSRPGNTERQPRTAAEQGSVLNRVQEVPNISSDDEPSSEEEQEASGSTVELYIPPPRRENESPDEASDDEGEISDEENEASQLERQNRRLGDPLDRDLLDTPRQRQMSPGSHIELQGPHLQSQRERAANLSREARRDSSNAPSDTAQDTQRQRNPDALDVYYDEELILSHTRDVMLDHENPRRLTGLQRDVFQAIQDDHYLSIHDNVERHNSLARRDVASMTSVGAFLLAFIFGAILQAVTWPYYNVYDTSDEPETPGFLREFPIVLGIIFTFSGVAKSYYDLEGGYWNYFLMKKKFDTARQRWSRNEMTLQSSSELTAGSREYLKFSLRRMFWSVATQMIFFNVFGVAAHQIRFLEFPTSSQTKHLNVGYLFTSIFGNLMWLPIFQMLRNPNDDTKRAARNQKAQELGFENREEIDSSYWSSFTHKYRRFLDRRGIFARGRFSKLQYLLRSTQFYFQYNLANTAFYIGYLVAIQMDPNLNSKWWRYVYVANLVRANLAVNSSFLSYLPRLLDLILYRNTTGRYFTRSYTLYNIRQLPDSLQRSPYNPLRYLINLGGVRLFNYKDTESLHPTLWEGTRRSLEVRRLQEILMDLAEDPKIAAKLKQKKLFGTTEFERHQSSRQFQDVRISISVLPDDEDDEEEKTPDTPHSHKNNENSDDEMESSKQ